MAKLRNVVGRVRPPDASSAVFLPSLSQRGDLQVHLAQSQACDSPLPPYQTTGGGGGVGGVGC